ncbi:MAG: class I SAM-dependent methyltransferase [Spirochaetales bacterium]|nr:class I SAM-dependent methyltransferase [Spirochaetales bacterium]
MAENNRHRAEDYIKNLENSNRISEKAIRGAIHELGLFPGCSVLDIPCGIGNHSVWMAEGNDGIKITGADFAVEHLNYATKLAEEKGLSSQIVFEKSDINNLDYLENSFDFVWCSDGLWPGPVETGCLAEEPYEILAEMAGITKIGGTIALLFWSSQKLLPGYPLLESELNATLAANIPVTPETDPDLHYMRAPLWLKRIGLKNIKSRTFAADIRWSADDEDEKSVSGLLDMFWGRAHAEVSPESWSQYKSITDLNSENCIFNRPDYAGFLTYTMFTGEVVK